ncbi:TraB/GumN family protein [Cyclobacterium marinum]|uniref:GumN family protein n=1 Tax=Cyclobacterium marinum (strain ATCC 25205 / DSM 745 / LMG 13164 / NCIMB 1802) TaxID=880070 RepID=G0IUH1_CYCMS|nr:TraB/GumN family protein [Cyclobacterium marinum]AEL24734.1 GumN family protein [Cyclobacterium marinum DSM 745]MBI0401789.1 TraB/GumN family protein [Cyclobacterium marinum]|tara:strand:+ start:87370 stop:88224 length:855 start_codon:yes stop_codon:yes gene_type:complete
MFKNIFFICLFSLGSISAFSQEEGVFWEIYGADSTAPSYLFGTIHLICQEDFVINEKIADKLAMSDYLVLEIDMDDPQLQVSMQQNLYNKEGQKITDFLSEEAYLTIHTYIKERTGMDMDMLKEMRPMVLMSLLYNNLLECETMSLEMELMALANTENKEILGLETVEEQMSFFDLIPLSNQYESFYAYIKDIEKGQAEFRKLINAYKEEKITDLLQMVAESPEYKDYQDEFLYERNQKWMKPMTQIMENGTAFFAVGAGHLAGPKGLINLLKSQGFTVRRIEM